MGFFGGGWWKCSILSWLHNAVNILEIINLSLAVDIVDYSFTVLKFSIPLAFTTHFYHSPWPSLRPFLLSSVHQLLIHWCCWVSKAFRTTGLLSLAHASKLRNQLFNYLLNIYLPPSNYPTGTNNFPSQIWLSYITLYYQVIWVRSLGVILDFSFTLQREWVSHGCISYICPHIRVFCCFTSSLVYFSLRL